MGWDLFIVLILATLLVIVVYTLPQGNIGRAILTLPILIFLPGYALVSALWPKKSDIDVLERVALSLGLSVALIALIGLGLNFTPWGITLSSIVASFYILILILVQITRIARLRLDREERFDFQLNMILDRSAKMTRSDKLLITIVFLTIVIGVVLIVYIAANPPTERYSELYLLDEYGTTENYPSEIDVNSNTTILIGVVCHEQETTDYTTEIRLLSADSHWENTTLAVNHFTLVDGEKRLESFNFSINATGTYIFQVNLYKEDETTTYATNHLWIDVA